MLLFETIEKHLPQRAGKATIRWIHDQCVSRGGHRLDGSTIILPFRLDSEFISLQGGNQFVYLRWVTFPRYYRQVLFGGTDDDNPFLTELIPSAVDVVAQISREGEEIFYQYLKPRGVKRLEDTFEVKAQRQGDIFAVATPWTWETLRDELVAPDGMHWKSEDGATGWEVFRTRHTLNGRYALIYPRHLWHVLVRWGSWQQWQWRGALPIGKTDIALFATGTVQAPGHPRLVLDDRLHALFRVEVLSVEPEAQSSD